MKTWFGKQCYLAGLLSGCVILGLIFSSCSTPMGNPEDGKRWYSMHNCFACHGPNGNDGKAPNIKDLDLAYWRFERIIRNAGSPIMPKYPKENISAQDVADIYALLKKK